MENKDIRWVQRFANYQKALQQLSKFIEKGELNELEEQGLIQSFEYTHELAWNTLKDFLENRGNKEIYGSKDTTREAFKLDLISEGEVWMDMIQSRNETSHTYNDETSKKISQSVINKYYPEFVVLESKLKDLVKKENK
ncbi:nucleotidyltransferase [candidate division WOR-1 bacterium RIFOXYD2_FULL_36_8]|uniref:Nucleotidyltransferase n=2 Tax=Bacteria TaxID=2 RepID=A0A1F4SEY5_UNCSA|nr:MAG: nucleotidyltransferase [candidate division WOR-1 bacterium RIFOXYB2_FULL_37_13]OGC39058.1 MAG: nucleotidyltransferase [candidate division WOR-1 bacterium RIFOXYD2_FULL_36_8]OGF21745.1 MAG: nucleotidyltransferase [Candidatus Falkowbacteria bacterium RIFOXYA2_FULL_38_12]